ncbi:MAG: 3-oxoacyl-ACP synthase [Bacteroidetes bacterium]|jgi:transcription elongation GreA/GreB family factor|nr:3-oxoacyl-ACP synthase [Bacteroidota bacterium]MBP6402625.1 3-oxoacyl-ACP synthase [Bacteroidia bacterium]MBK6839970.1 3-oxoacyl-ACP synthase [Bacteroidota bacterium]MBK9523783.1 3-oxoacyl-ACP synthase [Bacteroidota bacterium]MBK9541534.1 3-oxoacyl-ACP synthase [Bacteroidota bacterium]
MNSKYKIKLKKFAEEILQQRMETAQHAMLQAQDAANSEDKSSAGDKYETARAMGQLDREMNAKQFEEAKRELALLQSLYVLESSPVVIPGSYVKTDKGDFFISSGLGIHTVEGKKVGFLSVKSPLAIPLLGKSKGDTFQFNGQPWKVEELV